MTKQPWHTSVPHSSRSANIAGVTIIAVFVGGFGIWATTAPIAGAVVATGTFVAKGNNKIVQSMEGGIISKILVREGDVVEAGQSLLRLDETAPRVELRRLILRRTRLEAIEARLLEEADDPSPKPIQIAYHLAQPAAELASPKPTPVDYDDVELRSVIATQRLTLAAHRHSQETDISNLERSITSLEDHIRGDEAQRVAATKEILLYNEEIVAKQALLSQGLVRRPELLALQRAKASVDGEVGRLDGDLADTRDRVARTRDQIAGIKATAVKTAVDELVDVRGDLYDTRERIRSAEQAAQRVKIGAPVRGVVVKLGYHTPGGVIEPGKPIMELLPLDDELLIEARVRAQDIDSVKKDATTMVRLSALSARITPMVRGRVVYLSADSLQDDPRLDRSVGVYIVRVAIDKDQLPMIKDFVAHPGMPAEVYIKTSDRTFFSYLTRPVRDSMARAFRER